jgi:hypothetical protein
MKSKRMCSLLLLVSVLISVAAGAHEGGKHFLGMVKAFDQNTLTVATTNGGTVTFTITKATKFVKSGEPAQLNDLKKGERVVVHAKPSGESWEAQEVRFGATKKSTSL